MSFNPYDMIHTGNYESFFLLYIDQELSDAQMKMVDEFLAAHPELQSEFDLLVSTKLPVEHFSFDKESLMAENMHPGSVAEDLLLYLDDELPAEKKNIIEFELASNKDYQQQFDSLKKTKLDASEMIEFPYKKDLYRRTERVIAFRPWMRVAAAVIVIAVSGIVYMQKSVEPGGLPDTASNSGNHVKDEPKKITQPAIKEAVESTKPDVVNIAATTPEKQTKKEVKKKEIVLPQENKENIALQKGVNDIHESDVSANPITLVSNVGVANQAKEISKSVAATFNPVLSKETLNKSSVTSALSDRTTDVASNDKKGSVKGFLRKATRLIEKKTGIDPTNENGELLIGMVAVDLK